MVACYPRALPLARRTSLALALVASIAMLEGLGEFHSWGGRVGMRLFQLLSPKTLPKTPGEQAPRANAGLRVSALNAERITEMAMVAANC